MASIRLFGRGKSGSAGHAAAGGGPAVDAAAIAAALADLSTAAVSTTWRCRHAAGASIGEGAVDFGAHRSRATVVRGKRTYEYVRAGASVYRALVPDDDDQAAALPEPEPGEDDEAEEFDGAADALDELGDEDEEDGEAGGDGDEALMEADADADDETEDDVDGVDDEGGLEASDPSDADEDGEPSDAQEEPDPLGVDKKADGRAWQTFSEHDACGPHSYAEPAVLAQAVRRAGVVQPRKAEEFDGVTLSAFSVTVKPKPADPDKLLARLARQLRDHGANAMVVTAFTTGPDGPEAADGDAKPRIVRLRLELPHWTPADDPTADHAVSVDLYELGDPVRIELPDRDRATRRTARSCADLSLF